MRAYHLIEAYYGSRTAERSGVPLINHIHEGVQVLEWVGASQFAKEAYCLHPLVQKDEDLAGNHRLLFDFSSQIIVMTMEYRNIANASLADNPHLNCVEDIQLSPLEDVNTMLIADKVQNYKDFRLYHYGTHPRSERLDLYFQLWLKRLGVSFEQFLEYEEKMKAL